MLTKQLNIYLLIFVFLITAVFIQYTPYLIFLLFVAFLFVLYRKDFVLLLLIILFISFTSFAFKSARDVVTALTIATLFYLFLKKYGIKFSEYPAVPMVVFYFFVLLAVTLIFSTLFSTSFAVSLASLIHTVIFFSICYMFYGLLHEKDKIYLYVFGIILATFIIGISIYSDFFKAGFSFHLDNGILARFAGIYANPNVAGLTSFIASCLILSLFFIDKYKTKKFKWLLSFLLGSNLLSFIITDSRAAGIALIIGFTFILFVLKRKLLYKLILFIVPVVLILLMIPAVQNAVAILLRVNEGSRIHLWGEGLRMFGDHLLAGVGPGMYGHFYVTYTSSFYILLAEKLGQLFLGNPNPHNFIIAFAAENGLLGLLTAVSMFALFFYMSFKCMKAYKNTDRNYYVLSVAAFGIGLGVFENSFFEVMGIMSYGYITHDLPFWLTYTILIFMYKRINRLNTNKMIQVEQAV